jgi:hypothetical protein
MDKEQTPLLEVPASTSPALQAMVDAKLPPLTKKYKGMETYMTKGGIMREREVYYVVPSTSNLPPDECAVALSYANDRPKGVLFKGKNRKERRSSIKTGKK